MSILIKTIYLYSTTMTKKDYLIALLENITPDILPIKDDILYLIQNNNVTDDLISALYTIFHTVAKTVSSKEGKQKIEKSLTFLNKLKTIEEENTIQDKKDVEDLEKMLSDL